MQNPAAQVLGQARHGVGVVFRAVLLEIPDFAFERLAQGFVGVERKNPVVGGVLGGPVLLAGIAAPRGSR